MTKCNSCLDEIPETDKEALALELCQECQDAMDDTITEGDDE